MNKKPIFFISVLLLIVISGAAAFAQPFPPGGGTNGGGGSYTNYPIAPSGPGLKLDAPILQGTNLHLNLLEADPSGTYDIYFATNIPSDTWSNLAQGIFGQTNFDVPTPPFESGFFKTRRSDTPVANTESMTIYFPNVHIQSSNLIATVTGGPAASMAILIDDTNFATATWIPFSSVPDIRPILGEGEHHIWFGSQGTGGSTYWIMNRIFVDTTPPLIVITNPITNVGSRSIIQLQGYSPEPLASISFDVTNAIGRTVTNEPGFILNHFYDIDKSVVTTNWFQCFDVELTNGVNTITLHAVDLAGNVTVTNFSYTMDFSGDTNAPALNLYWPKNNSQISGDEFRVRGLMDDPSAKIVASIVGTNGVTNTVEGSVERDGLFWSGSLPLAGGTNALTLTATDAAGNMNTTNVTVFKSDLNLTIDAISENILTQTAIPVSGTINSTDHAIWVNGKQATLTDTNWSAEDVPLNEGGTAVIQVRAVPLSNNGGNGAGNADTNSSMANSGNPDSASATDIDDDIDKPSAYWVESYHAKGDVSGDGADGPVDNFAWIHWDRFQPSDSYQEVRGSGLEYAITTTWDPSPFPTNLGPFVRTNFLTGGVVTGSNAPAVFKLHLDRESHFCFDSVPQECGVWTQSADTKMTLFTGGKKLSRKKELFILSATAVDTEYHQTPTWIPPEEITLPQGKLGSDGLLHVALPDGVTLDFTPTTSRKNYNFTVDQTKHKLKIFVNGVPLDADGSLPLPTYCVGQKITFEPVFNPPSDADEDASVYRWVLSEKFVNYQWQLLDSITGNPYGSVNYTNHSDLLMNRTTSAWWVSGGQGKPEEKRASVGCNLFFPNGQQVTVTSKAKFLMHRPTVTAAILEPSENVRFFTIEDYDNFGSLKLGKNDESGDGVMVIKVDINSSFYGDGGITQIASCDYSNPAFQFEGYLDGSEFYASHRIYPFSTNIVKYTDGPSSLWISPNQVKADFKCYVRFRPDYGSPNSDNIFVTLGILTWQINGKAIKDPWRLITDEHPSPSTPNNSDEFPVWTHEKPADE